MLGFIYLLVATGATANQEATAVPAPPSGPVDSAASLTESERILLRKEGFAEPRGNPGAWVSSEDYPATALEEERTGVTAFRVQVDRGGRVASCEVTVSSGHADLDAATCKYVTERAVFNPALDKGGRPASGVYENRIRWQVPQNPIDFPKPGVRTFTYTVEKDGTVSKCNATGPDIDERVVCANTPAFVPPVNQSGDPVRKQIILITTTRVGTLADKE